MRFSEETLNRIREENPIEDVMGDFLDIKKAGKNYRALCPFHTEKTPSFFISPEKGIYHCFGCGKSGNAVTFLMDYKSMTFPEAVRFLAERAGIEIKGEKEKNIDTLKILEFASNLYHDALISSSRGRPGRAYLESRGIEEDTIRAFRLGYAPTTGKFLVDAAQKKGTKPELLGKAGLIKDDHDKFNKRIMFPVFNTSGRVIGFGSRVIDDGVPKYMNSPDTEVYKKSNSLYGLYQAKGDIRKEGTAILVEGNLDLLTVWQSGVKNVAASLGTSLTEGQANLLTRYTKKVILFYDSDEAGLKSTRKAIDTFLIKDVDVGVAMMPEGCDPDSLVRDKGIKPQELMKGAIDFLGFIISTQKANNPEDKIVLINGAKRTLALIRDPVKREVWVSEASKRLDISKSSLIADTSRPKRGEIKYEDDIDVRCRTEAKILGFALRYDKVWNQIRKEVGCIKTLAIKDIFESDRTDPQEVMEVLEPRLRCIIGDVLFANREKNKDLEQVNYLLCKIKNWDLRNDLRSMRETIRRMEKDNENIEDLLLEYEKLRRRIQDAR